MKRSPMPDRKTPMPRGNKPMPRGKGIDRTKKSKRKADDDALLEANTAELYRRSGGICEVQVRGRCEGRATNRHHRLDRSVGGTSIMPNLIHLCGSGTTGCHGYITHNPMVAEANGWTIRSGVNADPRRIAWRTFRQGHKV